MPRAPVPPAAAASGGCRSACVLALTFLGLLAGGARAELLGTHPHRNGNVRLITDLCRADDSSSGQRAWQTVGGRERQGCWGVDRAGNPVVTWRASRPRAPAEASTPTARPRAEVSRAAAPEPPSVNSGPRDFARPAWCPNANFPHERLVCTDAELAGRDLRLASLWWPYRRTLSRGAEAWHKSDYFRRLKACGADKACIVSEQDMQMRRYREGLPAGG